jgi:hypothetical protein
MADLVGRVEHRRGVPGDGLAVFDRDGAAVGPLSAPWLFLNVAQGPLYAALAATLGISAYFCLVRR